MTLTSRRGASGYFSWNKSIACRTNRVPTKPCGHMVSLTKSTCTASGAPTVRMAAALDEAAVAPARRKPRRMSFSGVAGSLDDAARAAIVDCRDRSAATP